MQPQRRSIRLRGYDYTQPGAYFVTVCCAGRRSLLAEVKTTDVALTPVGQIAERCWCEIPSHFPRVDLDTWVVMPNHFHGILILTEPCRGTPCRLAPACRRASRHERWRAPTAFQREAFGQPRPESLSTIVRLFKSATTRAARRARLVGEGGLWERGFYDRVIRGEGELERIRAYIQQNPIRWTEDDYYSGP